VVWWLVAYAAGWIALGISYRLSIQRLKQRNHDLRAAIAILMARHGEDCQCFGQEGSDR
jgi:hypothetical protein